MELSIGAIVHIEGNSGEWEFVEYTDETHGRFRLLGSDTEGIFPLSYVVTLQRTMSVTDDIIDLSEGQHLTKRKRGKSQK